MFIHQSNACSLFCYRFQVSRHMGRLRGDFSDCLSIIQHTHIYIYIYTHTHSYVCSMESMAGLLWTGGYLRRPRAGWHLDRVEEGVDIYKKRGKLTCLKIVVNSRDTISIRIQNWEEWNGSVWRRWGEVVAVGWLRAGRPSPEQWF